MKTVLHICNGFTTSRLYDELFCQLEDNSIKQYVVAPSFIGENRVKVNGSYVIEYFERKNSLLSRFQYTQKIKRLTMICRNYIDKVDIIHAHTWFSDGFVAYNLYCESKIPYIIAVRNSDINFFYKYCLHLRSKAIQVLKSASKIVLISPCYYNRLKALLPYDVFEYIKDKIQIIPNGINKDWLRLRRYHSKLSNIPHIVFCGNFDKNKNITGLIKAIDIVYSKGYKCKLSLIGKKCDDKYTKRIEALAKNSQCDISIYNRMAPTELREFYQCADIFAMPSFTETFGLVYIEALSQGLPIIYTKNEGIDGVFKDNTIGASTNSHSPKDIAKSIITIIDRYDRYSDNIKLQSLDNFKWENIAEKYCRIYGGTNNHEL